MTLTLPACCAPASAAATSSAAAAAARGCFAAFSDSADAGGQRLHAGGTSSRSATPSLLAASRSASRRCRHELLGRLAGDRLDPPQPGADARLAGDPERADLPGRRDVRPAAQLPAVAVDLDHAHALRHVLLAEEHVGAQLARVARAIQLGATAALRRICSFTRRSTSRSGDAAWPRLPESRNATLGPDPAARLLGLLADHVAQRAMQQVRRGVVARGPQRRLVDARLDRVAARQLALQPPDVHDRIPHALGVVDQPALSADELARSPIWPPPSA